MDLGRIKRMAKDFCAGALGGTACVLAGQPFDTIKVKMQSFPTLFKNAFECGLKTFRQEGVLRGLYAGTVPSLAANVAENSCLFLFYGQCLMAVRTITSVKHEKDLTVFHRACAGSGAAFFTSFALCPTELIKCKLQAQHQLNRMTGAGTLNKKSGVVKITMDIVRKEGFLGLFRGMTSTWAREVPGYFFFFGGYEFSRYMMTPNGGDVDDMVTNPLKMMLAGGFAGVALWTAIFPADVVKSRIQIFSSGKNKAPGFLVTLMNIYKIEGFKALYKGLGPTLVRCFPANGALFMAYEGTQKMLKDV